MTEDTAVQDTVAAAAGAMADIDAPPLGFLDPDGCKTASRVAP